MYVFAFASALFFFFLLLLILLFFSFPEKGFFVATFCMRSILFADSNREKKIVWFLSVSLSSHSTRNLYICFLFFCTTRRKRERERQRAREVSFSLSLVFSSFSSRRVRDTCMYYMFTQERNLFSFLRFLTNHVLSRYRSVSSFESTNDGESNIVFTITPIKVGGLDIMTIGTTGELS